MRSPPTNPSAPVSSARTTGVVDSVARGSIQLLLHRTYPHFTRVLPGVNKASVGLQYILVIWDDVVFRQNLSDRPLRPWRPRVVGTPRRPRPRLRFYPRPARERRRPGDQHRHPRRRASIHWHPHHTPPRRRSGGSRRDLSARRRSARWAMVAARWTCTPLSARPRGVSLHRPPRRPSSR